MRNDGRNAVWDMWCGLQCMWDNVMCDLYLNLAMCMAQCDMECVRDVEWCAEMWWSDLM